ncbi:MAG: hypothetical protein QX199_17845 [Methylococcaceae bacterium]
MTRQQTGSFVANLQKKLIPCFVLLFFLIKTSSLVILFLATKALSIRLGLPLVFQCIQVA